MILHFYLNDRLVTAEAAADENLLSLLRRLDCHSVRSGCDTSNCGICTVLLDEKPVLSCSCPAARAEGRRVTTVEGAGPEGALLTRILAEEGADQCGFCSPGLIMTVLALAREIPDASEEEVRAYLAGNLCRCTGYQSQDRAIMRFLRERRAE